MDTISLMIFHDTNTIVAAAQRRRLPLMLNVWGQQLDLFSLIFGQMVGYLLWGWWVAAWRRCSAWVFAVQGMGFVFAVDFSLIFVFAVDCISMILPGNVLGKLSGDDTSGALDRRMFGFIGMLASIAPIFLAYWHESTS